MKGGLGFCFKTTGQEGGIPSLKLPHPLFSVVMGLMTVGPPAYSDHLLILEQGLANCGLQAKSGLTPVFVKLCWNTALPVGLHIACGCSGARMAELSVCSRDHMACRA